MTVTQSFEGRTPDAAGAFRRAAVVTPDDVSDLNFETRAVYVASGGDLTCVMASGDTVTLESLLGGVMYPLSVHRILATGTSASGLVALA